MTLKLECPHAEYRDGMRIFCTKSGEYCGNQFYKRCKGWWALNANAARCPLRRDDHGQAETTAARGSDKV